MRRVIYISGSRADFGPARHTLMAIRDAPDLCLEVLVTGMHLDPVHGETWQEIADDGFEIAARVAGRVEGDTLGAMAAAVGLYLHGMSEALAKLRPDTTLVLGDRGEQLAGAMAAAFQNIPVAHLCGGSLSGSIDDSVRHAITKFAHLHLPASEEHARRIIQMGEDPAAVHVVGLPGGNLQRDVTMTREEVCAQWDLPTDQPYLLVVQHAVTHSRERAGDQIVETLEAVASLGHPTLLANPNDDAGGRVILSKMQEYAERFAHLRILPPPRSREHFASVMAHAGALVGNSSAAIVEAMSVHLPVVNIGDRQRGREHLACLLNAAYDRGKIQEAVDMALGDADHRRRLETFKSPLLGPDTPAEAVRRLRELDLGIASQPKRFLDLEIP